MRNFKEDYSLVRVLHAIPNGEEVDVYINGFPFYSGIRFSQFTPYIYVPEEKYTFSVYLKDEKKSPIAQREVTVNSDELITMAIILKDNNVELIPITEEMGLPQGNDSKFKFVHLALGLPEVNVLMNDEKIFENVSYATYTDYESIQPKDYKMDIELSKNNKILLSNDVMINPSRVYTFYAIGQVPNINIVQTLDGATFLN